jgi:thymidylate kinase
MSLLDYLPTPEEINECIKPEAEGAHEAVLLAVHRPTRLSYKFVNKSNSVLTNEGELLAHVVTQDVPTGTLVVPITGISGVGKSHLVRILDARLRRLPSAKKYCVVRIPKSASLRRVVELILEPLPDTYNDVKAAFRRAMADVDIESAAIHFRAHLIVSLKQYAKTLEERIGRGEPGLLPRLDHARRVSLLFDDPVTRDHFQQAVFPRIVSRAVAGSAQHVVDPLAGQFSAPDLNLPTSIDLSQAAAQTRKYYTLALNASDGRGKTIAAEVLNEVVDEATKQLFKLHESMGGKTLQEVILDIRRVLLNEGRELVLLIEDFAALTGVQETLSKVLIQEGVRDGKRVYATMRSVIAVTDGWTIGRETIASRAEREWIVESKIDSDDEVLTLTRAMVASYLNAARWGHQRLIGYYSDSKQDTSPAEWLPEFRSEDDETTSNFIQVFGFEADVPLFPFTTQAIEYLARNTLTERGGLVFNPRLIINQIIRRMLLPARYAFQSQLFPPAELQAEPPSFEVSQWLSTQPTPMRARYTKVAVIWGNNPPDLASFATPAGVFEAFGLPAPKFQGIRRPQVTAPPQTRDVDRRQPPEPFIDPRVTKFRAALEAWVQKGERLQQSDASVLRRAIAGALKEAIDLNAERCRDFEISVEQISIPNAAGEAGLSSDAISIAPDANDEDGRLRRELLAVYRLRVIYPHGNDYEEFEDDVASMSNFVERILPHALARIRAQITRHIGACVSPLAMCGHVLGIPERGKTVSAVHGLLFETPPAEEEGIADSAFEELKEWRAFQTECRAARAVLQAQLLKGSGSFQGAGRTALAVDIVRVAELYRSSDPISADVGAFSAEEKQLLRGLPEVRVRARAKAVLKRLLSISHVIEKELGSDFDKAALLDSMRSLADLLKGGAWDSDKIGLGYPSFSQLLDKFQAASVKESLGVLAQAAAETNPTRMITRVGQLKFAPILLAEAFALAGRALVQYANQQTSMLEHQYGDVTAASVINDIRQAFNDLRSSLTVVSMEAEEQHAPV